MLFKKMFHLTCKLTVDCKTVWSSVTAVRMSADDLTFLPFGGVAQCTVFTKPVVSRQMWSREQQAPWDLGLAPLKVSCSNAKQCTVSLS